MVSLLLDDFTAAALDQILQNGLFENYSAYFLHLHACLSAVKNLQSGICLCLSHMQTKLLLQLHLLLLQLLF